MFPLRITKLQAVISLNAKHILNVFGIIMAQFTVSCYEMSKQESGKYVSKTEAATGLPEVPPVL
jgi:hypothetical protein